jgi:hypothetical protein
MADKVRAIDAVKIEALTLVPLLTVQRPSSSMLKPKIFVPAVSKSGFIFPIPSSNDQVVIPLDEKGAILVSDWSKEPTPITLIKSPGLFKVP